MMRTVYQKSFEERDSEKFIAKELHSNENRGVA